VTDWRTIGPVHKAMWDRELFQAKSPLYAVKDEAYEAAGDHTALCLAILDQESSYAKRFRFNVESNYNPLNLRPPGGDGYLRFSGWTEGIRAWRERITDPTYRDGIYARTRTIAELIHVYAPASDSNDEAAYVAGIEQSLLRWGVTPQEVQPSMATIVAKECPVETYVTWAGDNRPGLAMPSPSKIVTHEVGNKSPGADEDMHRAFVLNGGGEFDVSFHFVVGPDKIVQLLFLDENAWHASDGYYGDGNRDAWGIEHIQIGDFNKTMQHAAWLQAELVRNPRRFAIKNPAAFVPDINRANVRDRMVRHYDEAPDKKYCPEMIMNRGLWEPLKDAVVTELDRTMPKPEPKYATPLPITWKAGDLGWKKLGDVSVYCLEAEVEVVRATTPLAWADGDKSDGEKAPNAGPKIKQGERVKVIGSFANLNENGQTVRWLIRASDNARIIGSSCRPLLPVKQ